MRVGLCMLALTYLALPILLYPLLLEQDTTQRHVGFQCTCARRCSRDLPPVFVHQSQLPTKPFKHPAQGRLFLADLDESLTMLVLSA